MSLKQYKKLRIIISMFEVPNAYISFYMISRRQMVLIWLVPVYISLNQEVKEQIRSEAKRFIYFTAIWFD